MNTKNKKPVTPVTKPFLTGGVTDEGTWKSALGFLGLIAIIAFMTFLVCSMTGFDSMLLRLAVNGAVIVMVAVIFYNQGMGKGTEAVARGETMYQRKEKGLPVSDSEVRMCFHPAKGFVVGLIGTAPLLVIALVLAVTAQKTTTGYGVLPAWVSAYMGRSEVGDALVAYTQAESLGVTDILRIIVRILIMPWVSIIGSSDRTAMLWLERLSPLILLIPTAAYGIGYLQGKRVRSQILTDISENAKKRRKREQKARKKRMAVRRGPEQLN